MLNKSYPAELVWAASCAAQRVNGSYIKYQVDSNMRSNRQLIIEYIEKDIFLISEIDYKTAREMKRYFQGMIFKILAEQYITPFEKAAIEISAKDEISHLDIALIAAIPSIYYVKLKEDNINERLANAKGGTFNKDEKINTTIELLKSVYSRKWAKYYNTGITIDDKVIFFSTYIALKTDHKYDISGKVIDLINENTSKLKYVKVQKYGN